MTNMWQREGVKIFFATLPRSQCVRSDHGDHGGKWCYLQGALLDSQYWSTIVSFLPEIVWCKLLDERTIQTFVCHCIHVLPWCFASSLASNRRRIWAQSGRKSSLLSDWGRVYQFSKGVAWHAHARVRYTWAGLRRTPNLNAGWSKTPVSQKKPLAKT